MREYDKTVEATGKIVTHFESTCPECGHVNKRERYDKIYRHWIICKCELAYEVEVKYENEDKEW